MAGSNFAILSGFTLENQWKIEKWWSESIQRTQPTTPLVLDYGDPWITSDDLPFASPTWMQVKIDYPGNFRIEFKLVLFRWTYWNIVRQLAPLLAGASPRVSGVCKHLTEGTFQKERSHFGDSFSLFFEQNFTPFRQLVISMDSKI